MGDDLFFLQTVLYRGGTPGVPPKTPKNGQKRRFWVTPQKQGFWGAKCEYGRLSSSSFSNFSKKSVFDKRGGPPPRGGPPLGGTPPRGGPPTTTDRRLKPGGRSNFFSRTAKKSDRPPKIFNHPHRPPLEVNWVVLQPWERIVYIYLELNVHMF
jgi:hypothetical protein